MAGSLLRKTLLPSQSSQRMTSMPRRETANVTPQRTQRPSGNASPAGIAPVKIPFHPY
jgi:hypothetical protein